MATKEAEVQETCAQKIQPTKMTKKRERELRSESEKEYERINWKDEKEENKIGMI